MEERTRAYRRHHRFRAIHHKRQLITKMVGRQRGYDEFPVDGQLAKGKIHCSCSMCKQKVKNNGWKHSDKQQLIRAKEFYEWEGLQLRYC